MPAERTRHLPGLGVNDGRECQDDDGGEVEFHCIGNDSSSRGNDSLSGVCFVRRIEIS